MIEVSFNNSPTTEVISPTVVTSTESGPNVSHNSSNRI